jgi:tetratricopeptide (TPR) repeat protein
VGISQEELDTSVKSAESADKLKEAKVIVRKGQLDEAIKLADEAFTLNPKNTQAKILAKSWKDQKIQIESDIAKSRRLMTENKFVDARRAMIMAKNTNPYYKPSLDLEKELNQKQREYDNGVNKGLASVRLANQDKQFKEAIRLAQDFRGNYQLSPGNERTLAGYEQFARTHDTEKDKKRGILAQGESKFNSGDYAGAIKDFDQMYLNFNVYWNINKDPEPKKYGDLKIEAVRRQKRIAQVRPNINRAIEHNQENEGVLNEALGYVDEVLGFTPNNAEFQGYRSTINGLLKNRATRAKVKPSMDRGNSLYQAKDYKSSVKEYDKVIKIDPSYAEAYRRRAMSKRARGDKKGALKDFNKAIELAPQNHQAHLGRGLLNSDMKKYGAALNDFTRGIELDPRYANGYFYRGNLRRQRENYSGAISDYNAAIRLDPKKTAAYINRGLAKSKLGDLKGALRDYNSAIRISPANSMAHNNRGSIKERQNNLKGALADYKKAVRLDSSNKIAKRNLDRLNAKLKPKPAATPRPRPTPRPPSRPSTPSRTERDVVNVNNGGGVRNRPTSPTKVRFNSTYKVTYIRTYHWNNGRGTSRPGTIGLRHSNGKMYGPWRATGKPGQGGVRNAYWEVRPNATLPAGTYTIVDSNPATWAQNRQSGGKGFATVRGYPVSGRATTPSSGTKRMKISVTYINASRRTVHLYATGERLSAVNRLAPGKRRVASGDGPIFTAITVYAKNTRGQTIHSYKFGVVPNGKYTVTFGTNNKLKVTSGSSGSTSSARNVRMSLTLVNLSSVATHIFPEEGNSFGPHNRLGKSEATRTVGTGPAGGRLKIVAGRNGRVLTYIYVPIVANRSYTITYGRNAKLTYKIN